MHRCPCALTFPSLSDLRLHQDRCSKFASIIKLPPQTSRLEARITKTTQSSRLPEYGMVTHKSQVKEVPDFSSTPRLTTRNKQTGRGNDIGGPTESGTSQRKRTSLSATKKTTTPHTSAFLSARMSPHNAAKVPTSKNKRAVTGQTAFTTDSAVATSSKSTSGRLLLWQQLDQERAVYNKSKIKSGRQNFLAPGRMRGLHKEVNDAIDINDPTHLRAHISPNLRLVIDGVEDSDPDETSQLHPQELGPHAGIRDENGHDNEPLDAPMDSPHEIEAEEEELEEATPTSEPEGLCLPPADYPRLTIVTKRKAARKLYSFYATDSESEHEVEGLDSHLLEGQQPANQAALMGRSSTIHSGRGDIHDSEEPNITLSDKSISSLKTAAQPLTLPCLRMQATKQLPFLRRNLAAGFFSRCQLAHIPIYSDNRAFVLRFHYEHIDGIFYETAVDVFRCPLCNLLGTFQTQEMLQSHLAWDHTEVVHEWQIEEYRDVILWKLKILVPETIDQRGIEDNNVDKDPSILPYVALSPPQSPEPILSCDSVEPVIQAATPPPEKKEELYEPTTSLSVSRSALSHHQGSESLASMDQVGNVTHHQRLRPPLGPAACYPYLPAESDYGGPTVPYSCRPGGQPCLFDLLGTLPLEPYGLLSWEVIDREEEIYESDDIKEEYKIMHALWGRWIMLNRTKFIANYAKGVTDFVDYYWKFIHLASGWDGLRYWLLMLHANRFLTPFEVAKTLNRYESLTDMSDF